SDQQLLLVASVANAADAPNYVDQKQPHTVTVVVGAPELDVMLISQSYRYRPSPCEADRLHRAQKHTLKTEPLAHFQRCPDEVGCAHSREPVRPARGRAARRRAVGQREDRRAAAQPALRYG